MIMTFAFPKHEYACLPCNQLAPMFNDNDRKYVKQSTLDDKERKWRDELAIIARRIGDAECLLCDEGTCTYCIAASNPNYKFKFWKSRERKHI